MVTRYFIDESGNTGDLARTGHELDFGGQPIFSLACVGLGEGGDIGGDVDQLKVRHKVAMSELKASQLHSRPAFILDLLDLLEDRRAPVLVEVAEKRFMVAIYLVNHQLLTGGHHVGDEAGEALARALVEYIAQAAPAAVLAAFTAACVSPGNQTVIASMTAVRDWAQGFEPAFQLSEIAAGLAQSSLDELEQEVAPDDPYSFRRYLPAPDDGPTGKPMWMLPGLSSFTNLYARLNLLHGKALADVALVHDEQRYVEGALRDGKSSMETQPDVVGRMTTPFADYRMASVAPLEFRSSADEIGLQIADVIAGVMSRHMKTVLGDPRAERPLQAVCRKILTFEDADRGLGVNFIATDRLLHWAGIHTF